MKKRLISIFLIISVIISVFAVGAFTISAAEDNEDVISASGKPLLASPTNIKMTDYGSSVTFSWNAVSGAKRYAVMFREFSSGYSYEYTSSLNKTITNLSPEKTYYFAIAADTNASRTGDPYGYFSNTYVRPGKPQLGNVSNMVYKNQSIININWLPVSWNGADNKVKYYVYYRYKLPNSNSYSKWYSSDPTTNTYWNIKNPQYGVKFQIEIHAVFSTKENLILPSKNTYTVSNSKTITAIVPKTPVYGINYSGNYFNVHWNKIPGAVKYEVARWINGECEKFYCDNDKHGNNNIEVVNNQINFKDMGIYWRGPYIYQIRAISEDSVSPWSSYKTVYYDPKVRVSRSQRLVDLAQQQKGTFGNKYWEFTGYKEPVDWCACYAAWLLCESSGLCLQTKEIEKTYLNDTFGWSAGVGQWADNLKARGMWHDRGKYTPKAGDVIVFGEPDYRTHVGVVTAVKNGYVYTTEGNKDTISGSGDYCTRSFVSSRRYALTDSNIVGYGETSKSLK